MSAMVVAITIAVTIWTLRQAFSPPTPPWLGAPAEYLGTDDQHGLPETDVWQTPLPQNEVMRRMPRGAGILEHPSLFSFSPKPGWTVFVVPR
jgi:hypothetical protein